MPKRKRNISLILLIAVIIIFVFVMTALGGAKNTIVIEHGIVFYRGIRRMVLIVGVILIVLLAILFLRSFIRAAAQSRRDAKEEAKRRAAEDERISEEKRSSEPLSMKKNMDSVRLRQILDDYSNGDWRNLAGEMRQIHIQLDLMDEQQEKLSRLLKNNGADALSNTEEILDQVEQHMCQSVRKVINYMDVASPERQEDVKKVLEKLYACHADNQTQLQQVQEFLFALADFLNTQGDNDNSAQMLELYKSTILDSIKDQD